MADLDDLRKVVTQSCRIIGKMDMTREPAGHVSCRIPGTDRILIKARGPGEAALRYVTPDDLIIVDMDGNRVDRVLVSRTPEGSPRPSTPPASEP